MDQVCDRWSISRTVLYRWRRAGLPVLVVGRVVRFDPEAVDAWIIARGDGS